MAQNIGLFGNFVIAGTIKTKEGIHIGAPKESVEIGGIDSPVIKHPINGAPYIPGSSFKGKMRSIVEKFTMSSMAGFQYNRSEKGILQHVCDDIDFSYNSGDNLGAKKCPVCRVYGSTGKNRGNNYPARIIVRDCNLSETGKKFLTEDDLYVFEAKTETSIHRITAQANPRTIERVPEGAEFLFEIIYKVFCEKDAFNKVTVDELTRLKLDIKNIFEVLALIQRDSLGGNISRGSGKVEFNLTEDKCRYYKIGGGSSVFLPLIDGIICKDFEKLRQYDFSNLDMNIN
ncbi:MAG: type III-A CRISPR-associated RAMP protein Csm3 [Ignavibacteriaceae bacterium]